MLAGLQAGDVLVKINDTSIDTEEALTGFLKEAYANQRVTITVERMGRDGTYQKVVCKTSLDTME